MIHVELISLAKELKRFQVRIPIDHHQDYEKKRTFVRITIEREVTLYACSNFHSIDWEEFVATDDIHRNLVHHSDRIA